MEKTRSLFRNILNSLVQGTSDALVAEKMGVSAGLPPGTMATVVAAKSLIKGTAQTLALSVYDDIFDREISQIEVSKVNQTFDEAERVFWQFVEKEGENEAGYKFNGDSPEYQNALSVAEGIMFQSMREHERKKLNVLGAFYGKSLYEGKEQWEYLYHTLKMTDRLTYRQLVIIRLICDKFPGKDPEESITEPDACVETMDLLNFGIWGAPGAFLNPNNSNPIQLKILQPTDYARTLCKDMMLERLPEEELCHVLDTLKIKKSAINNELLSLEEVENVNDAITMHEL